ncbi:conserved membrane hypothetical protein [Desulfosarcina cetonica]|uniref:TRAP transporter small permease subunit n=1 Tax=Desulfosarcina cetonica TaxID=90730 RepID=UPI0006D0E03F|nr:TRAP transporter small permease subunit [Desulfosarcina cetonica]VTR67149.1 conserved membrane hypothetical protein [Desulfosarcina cetonica]
MKALETFCRAIDRLSEITASIAIYLVVALTAVLGYEVVARYLFNSPTKWSFDLSYMLGGTYFLLGEAFTLKNGRQVRIDIFYNRFRPRVRAIIDSVFYLIFFLPLWLGIIIYLVPYVHFSFQMQERSMQGYWQPLIYPFKAVMLAGVCLLFLQGAAELVRRLHVAIKGE